MNSQEGIKQQVSSESPASSCSWLALRECSLFTKGRRGPRDLSSEKGFLCGLSPNGWGVATCVDVFSPSSLFSQTII